MHMQAEDKIRSSEQLHLFDELIISLVRKYLLVAPISERMCTCGSYFEALCCGKLVQELTERPYLFFGILDRLTDARPHFSDGLVYFGLDTLSKDGLVALKYLQDVRLQIPRNGINKLKF